MPYIGRTIDIVYDPADISFLTVEDGNSSFRINELTIGTHAGVRPQLPDSMADVIPETSRLLDELQKRYDKHHLPTTRAISYAQINQSMRGGEDHV